MNAPVTCRLEGTIEQVPRGLFLRDRDGMWWRLDCSDDLRPYLTGTIRIAGIQTPAGRVEVLHVAGLAA